MGQPPAMEEASALVRVAVRVAVGLVVAVGLAEVREEQPKAAQSVETVQERQNGRRFLG